MEQQLPVMLQNVSSMNKSTALTPQCCQGSVLQHSVRSCKRLSHAKMAGSSMYLLPLNTFLRVRICSQQSSYMTHAPLLQSLSLTAHDFQ